MFISYVHILYSYHLFNHSHINSYFFYYRQQWRLAAEYSCDRAALLVAQDHMNIQLPVAIVDCVLEEESLLDT